MENNRLNNDFGNGIGGDFEYFDPVYSEYNPLSEEIRNEMQKLLHPEKKENTGFCASLIRKLMPCNLT